MIQTSDRVWRCPYALIWSYTLEPTNFLRLTWRVQEVWCESRPWLQNVWFSHRYTKIRYERGIYEHMCLVHSVPDATLWWILLRYVPMVPKCMCWLLPLHLNFWMPIALIYWFVAYGRDRLIPLLIFAWRILTPSLTRSCHIWTTRGRDGNEIFVGECC